MLTKTKIALAAALVLGTASAALAEKDNANDEFKGGYRIGPLGQHFSGVNPVYHRSLRGHWTRGGGAYGFAPGFGGPCERFTTYDPYTGAYMVQHACR